MQSTECLKHQVEDSETRAILRPSRVGFRYLRLKRLRESLLPLASGSGSPTDRCDVSLIVPTSVAEEFSYVNSYMFDANPKMAKFFVCKSNCEENVFIALRFGVWSPSSSEFLYRLKEALRGHSLCAAASDTDRPPSYIFFSVSGSGMFLGMCQLIGINERVSLKWPDGIIRKGAIMLKWIFVHDIPNSSLEHLLVQMAHCPSTREPQPLPQCREGQEVPLQKGKEIMKIFRHAVRHGGVSLLDDVAYYDKKFKKAGMDLDDSHTTIGGEKAKPAVQSRVQSNKTVKEFLEAWLPTRPSPEEVDWRIHSRERFESNKAAIADQLGSKFAAVEGGKRDWMRDKARIKGARHYQDDVLSLLSASTAPSESSLEDQLAAKKAELDDAQQEVDEMTSRVKAEAGKEYETVTKIIDEDVGPASQALERYWQEVEEKTAARAERIQADSGLRRAMDTAMATVDYTDNASKLIAKTDELRKVPEQLTESRSVEKEKDIIDSFIVQARLCITQATSVAPRIGAVVSKRMEILIEESKNITYTKLEDLVTSSWEWMMSTVTVESLSRPRSPPVTGKDVIGLVNILDEVEGLYSEVAQTGSFTSNDGCWSFEALTTKLLQQRFLYHFAREGASTNRLDRPEWAIARFVDIWKHSQTVFDRWLAEAGQENSADLKKKLDLNFAKSLGKYFWDSRWPIVLDSTQLFAHHLSQYLAAVSDVEVFAGEESSDELIRSLTASPVLLQAWASADLAACTSSLNQVENPWSPDETRTAFNALGSTLIDLIENESTTRTCYLTKNSTAMAYFTESMYWPLIERFISMEKEKWNDLPTLSGEDEPTARLIQQSLEGIFKWLMEGPFDDKRLQALLSEHAQEIGDLGDKMAEMIQEECGS